MYLMTAQTATLPHRKAPGAMIVPIAAPGDPPVYAMVLEPRRTRPRKLLRVLGRFRATLSNRMRTGFDGALGDGKLQLSRYCFQEFDDRATALVR